jgi:hypothetical protein
VSVQGQRSFEEQSLPIFAATASIIPAQAVTVTAITVKPIAIAVAIQAVVDPAVILPAAAAALMEISDAVPGCSVSVLR